MRFGTQNSREIFLSSLHDDASLDTNCQVESEGMMQAHIRDAHALVEFAAFMEDQIQNQGRTNWTELAAAELLSGNNNSKSGGGGVAKLVCRLLFPAAAEFLSFSDECGMIHFFWKTVLYLQINYTSAARVNIFWQHRLKPQKLGRCDNTVNLTN